MALQWSIFTEPKQCVSWVLVNETGTLGFSFLISPDRVGIHRHVAVREGYECPWLGTQCASTPLPTEEAERVAQDYALALLAMSGASNGQQVAEDFIKAHLVHLLKRETAKAGA